ncbi:oligoendopeptidase F [Streptococcaceae bacterium ESL0729]|nr:oligoendopeptidase F [Streptococcaceae bacterium ESL0729]
MVKNRNEVAEARTWDLTTIYPSDEAWERDYEEISRVLDQVVEHQGHLTDSAKSLLDITKEELGISQVVERLYVYASMKNDQDTRVARYQELQAKATAIFAKFGQAFAFYEPEFMSLTKEELDKFKEEEPELNDYNHFFEKMLVKKDHILSAAEEALLAGASEIFGASAETFEILDNADISFPEVKDSDGELVRLTHGNYITLMESKDRIVRQGAYKAMYSIYKQFENTYAKTLSSTVKVHNFEARTRRYESARQAALSQNNIPESVFESLIASVNKHLPLLHRYISLRKKILGLEDLKMYDMYAPLSTLDYKFTYDEAVEKTLETLEIFGTEYLSYVKRSFDERWIDVEENAGKRSGAYSGGSYDTNAFMLLNWHDTLDNLYTLVHEMGHSMHSTFTRKNQPYVYGDYSIFLAEIASTTNENILTELLLDQIEDDKTRFAILNHYLDGFRGTVFRQTQFAEFEDKIHAADAQGQVLTSEFMNDLYADLNEKYYGLAKDENPEIQYEWGRIPHFYYNYYVFQYATGFAAASYLAERIVHGDEKDKEAYLDYLKAGNSDYPLEVIGRAGLDMTKSDYLDEAFKVFESRLGEFEDLVERGAYK